MRLEVKPQTQTQTPRRKDLAAAFNEFNNASGALAGAFDTLQSRVAFLTAELRSVRAARQQEYQERDRLASRLSALLEALPGGVLVLDAERRVAECNPAAIELLGIPVLGQKFATLLARARAATPCAEANGHTDVELASGRFIGISRRDFATTADAGEVVLLTDTTESHLMGILMQRQQRLVTLGELAAALAHQIRTPLAAALLYASQMNLPNRTPQDLRRCALNTRERLRELDKLINDMLAFARGGAASEVANVSALLEQVAQWLTPALEQGAKITIRTLAPELRIRGSVPSLVGALLNLATNALEAGGSGTELTLLARHGSPGRAEVVVSDNGPGVPAHLREKIFEPFFTTRKPGTGLGLAIVRSVAEAHGGLVRLDPNAKTGASFVIDLPAETSK
jgi:two-component system, sensor histidine kinase FlrB